MYTSIHARFFCKYMYCMQVFIHYALVRTVAYGVHVCLRISTCEVHAYMYLLRMNVGHCDEDNVDGVRLCL
jgi:hypothetical protein